MVNERRMQGETIQGILTALGLDGNDTNRKVLMGYLLAKPPPSTREFMQETGLTRPALFGSIWRIRNRLEGRDPNEYQKRQYRAMDNRQLVRAIHATGAKNGHQLLERSYGLYAVAKERGVLQTVFPSREVLQLQQIREAVRHRLGKRRTEDVNRADLQPMLRYLREVERDILLRRVYSDTPEDWTCVQRRHGIRNASMLFTAQDILLRKLRGKRTRDSTRNLVALRKVADQLGRVRMYGFAQRADPRKRAILRERVRTNQPKTLAMLARRFHVEREYMRKIEERLLKELEQKARRMHLHTQGMQTHLPEHRGPSLSPGNGQQNPFSSR